MTPPLRASLLHLGSRGVHAAGVPGVRSMIAALFVIVDGVYSGRPDVECWDIMRDARKYAGPHAVVAHPPCERWGRYWSGGPSARVRRQLGDDDGCFASALASVRKWGGVLEHPEASHAWKAHGLFAPPKSGFWIQASDGIGWTCCVEQGHYGHKARKATWLYSVNCVLPSLRWGPAPCRVKMDQGYHSKEERARATKTGIVQGMSHRQRKETPQAFADLLLSTARTVGASDLRGEDPDQDSRQTRDLFMGML
jgi:hypothetical protein